MTELRTTALHATHADAGARMVDFHGWSMPLHYGSQVEEHHAVRGDAGVFDVSHMTVVDVTGEGARDYLRHLLANDVEKLREPGRALYALMLNDRGGVVDDLIAYRRDVGYRLVVNSATREKDVAWMQARVGDFPCALQPRDDVAMLAVQGPRAEERLGAVADALPGPVREFPALRPFRMIEGDGVMISRTGYTGEDGFELVVPGDDAPALWSALLGAGVAPCGLAARDTLRLEAGLNLYGQDMDEDVLPAAANVQWTVSLKDPDRDFVGRAAVEGTEVPERLRGIVLETRGVLRAGQVVDCGAAGTGVLTSGAFSPTLGCGIGFARVPAAAQGQAAVEVRGRALPARLVDLPFVRNGERVFA